MVDEDLLCHGHFLVKVENFIETGVFVGALLPSIDENRWCRPEKGEERFVETRIAGKAENRSIVFVENETGAEFAVLTLLHSNLQRRIRIGRVERNIFVLVAFDPLNILEQIGRRRIQFGTTMFA